MNMKKNSIAARIVSALLTALIAAGGGAGSGFADPPMMPITDGGSDLSGGDQPAAQIDPDDPSWTDTYEYGTFAFGNFQADLTDILRVEGLVEKGTALHQGMKIVPKDKKIFSSIQALSKIVSKLEMKPDYVEITDGSHMSLHFGTIIIALGKDTNLETKMSRAAAIMEQLTGMSGTLHLETYTDSTVNIVFETDAVTEPEKRDSEDDSAWEDLQEYEENEGLDISWAEAWNQHNNEEGDKKKPEDGSEESTEGEIQTDAHGYYGTNGYQSQDYG